MSEPSTYSAAIARIEQLERENLRLMQRESEAVMQATRDAARADANAAEVSRLNSELNRKDCRVISHRIDGGEAWLWQGDGEDHLESLTCPVVIRPEVLKRILDDLRDAQASLDRHLGTNPLLT